MNIFRLLQMNLSVLIILISGNTFAQSPFLQPDETFITISGTVEEVYNDAFVLNYGDGEIRVEMDDGDRDADAYKLLYGDEVKVAGMIDRGFYEQTKIEAGTVYVKDIDTYFFSSAIDEEEYYVTEQSMEMATTTLHGRVTAVGVDDFTISSGDQRITIEVDEMGYDPLDDEGYQKVEVNDIVSVTGHIDFDMFENHSFEAEGISTLVDAG